MSDEKTCPDRVLVPIDHFEAHALLDAIEMVERILAAIDTNAAAVYGQDTDALHTRLVLIADDLCPHSSAVIRNSEPEM